LPPPPLQVNDHVEFAVALPNVGAGTVTAISSDFVDLVVNVTSSDGYVPVGSVKFHWVGLPVPLTGNTNTYLVPGTDLIYVLGRVNQTSSA
jgi:hypothetical protein